MSTCAQGFSHCSADDRAQEKRQLSLLSSLLLEYAARSWAAQLQASDHAFLPLLVRECGHHAANSLQMPGSTFCRTRLPIM